MGTKNIEKAYKRALIGGLVFCGIGIALISWGVFIWITAPSYNKMGAMGLWLISGLILLYGVLSLVDFIKLKKLAAMSQSDVSKMFACPRCGTVGAIYLIKVVGPKILIKQRCPIHGGRLFRLPLRLRDHCISYFRDTIFRCYKCGQEATVDHVRFSGNWTLIKVSCPTHGNRLPYHKIWRTVYTEISKEVIVAPQPAQPQPIPSKKIMFCPNCGEKFTGVDQTFCQNCGSKID